MIVITVLTCSYYNYVKAARRQLEHQRQLEWERQRRDQLMSESQREHSHVDKLRLEIGQHKQELDIIVCYTCSAVQGQCQCRRKFI